MDDNNLTFTNDNPSVLIRCEKDCKELSCVEDVSVFQSTAKQVCLNKMTYVGNKIFH